MCNLFSSQAMEVVGSVVGADKQLLTRRPAGGTRFTRKTMSTRSDAHMHGHRPTHFIKYSCEDSCYETTKTSNLGFNIQVFLNCLMGKQEYNPGDLAQLCDDWVLLDLDLGDRLSMYLVTCLGVQHKYHLFPNQHSCHFYTQPPTV